MYIHLRATTCHDLQLATNSNPHGFHDLIVIFQLGL